MSVRYWLDTNLVSDLIKRPQGPVAQHIAQLGEETICTSLKVAAALRYGVAKRASVHLSERVEIILGALKVLPLESPLDALYGEIRADLEREGKLIGPNNLLIAAHALSLDAVLVT